MKFMGGLPMPNLIPEPADLPVLQQTGESIGTKIARQSVSQSVLTTPKNLFLSLTLTLSLTLFTFFSCSSTNEIRRPPSLKIAELTLSKGIDKGAIAHPINPTSAFITQDTEAIASLNIENMNGRHTIRWDWHGTDGKINYTSGDYQVNVSKNKFHKQFTI